MNAAAEALLGWYDRHRRTLPWRGARDPYAVWVSEIMLQQTRVETVIPYYEAFLRDFPTVRALAEAPEEAVLKRWEGLGYYSRARNLQAGARQVMAEHGGEIPHSAAELRGIRGVGEYTAGAIASIAFGERVPAVDGNVVRVVTRLRGIRENAAVPSVRRRIAAEAGALVPEERPGDFNQALMDLGAGVCVPGTPDCDACPLAAFCDALREGDPDELPVLPGRTPPREECLDVLLLARGGRLLMRRRTERMLGGLWVFPMTEGWREAEALPAAAREETGLTAEGFRFLGEGRHVFTHRVWRMRVWAAACAEDAAPEGWRFVSAGEMAALPLPTAMRVPAALARAWLDEKSRP